MRCYVSEMCETRYSSCACYTLVRLVGNENELEGRLEVRYNGIWGTVCASGFTDATAKVACYVLGYGYASWVSCCYCI